MLMSALTGPARRPEAAPKHRVEPNSSVHVPSRESGASTAGDAGRSGRGVHGVH